MEKISRTRAFLLLIPAIAVAIIAFFCFSKVGILLLFCATAYSAVMWTVVGWPKGIPRKAPLIMIVVHFIVTVILFSDKLHNYPVAIDISSIMTFLVIIGVWLNLSQKNTLNEIQTPVDIIDI